MMKYFQKKIVVLLTIIPMTAAAFIYFLLYNSSDTKNITDVIRIGYAVEAPYVVIEKNGNITGEAPEIAKKVCEKLGIRKIELHQTEFNSLIPDLLEGKFDIIAAGMFITKERSEKINFAEPTFHVQQALLVPKGNPLALNSYFPNSMPKIKFGVIIGSIEESIFLKSGINDSQLVKVPDAVSGKAALESGLIDGFALSLPAVRQMVKNNLLGNTEVAAPFEQPAAAVSQKMGYGSFGFRPEDKTMLDKWNSVLAEFIGSKEHLIILKLSGLTEDELPGKISTKEILF